MSDDETRWIAQARNGNQAAFRHLVDAHARALYAVCVRITGEATSAEDAVQEALFNAYRHLPSFDGRAQFATWLKRIAINEALQQVRKRGGYARVDQLDDTDPAALTICDPQPSPERIAGSAELARVLEHQLAAMTALERTAFSLRHHEGQSIEEIAGALSMNISACKQAVFRAVRKLRGALQAYG